MPCKACLERVWSHEGGSSPKCSFDASGKFTNDGWNCATMNELREIADSGAYGCFTTRVDDESIGVVPTKDGEFIVMTWYKNRGRTGMAVTMCDEGEPRLLSLELAEAVCNYASRSKNAD